MWRTEPSDRRRLLLREVLTAQCEFYRSVYGQDAGRILHSVSEGTLRWSDIPFLTRADIASCAFAQRTYVPWSDLEAIRATSGSTGRGIMCMGRIVSFNIETLFDRTMRACGVARVASMSGAQFIYASTSFRRGMSVAIDPSDTRISAAIITSFRPDTITGTCHALIAILPLLDDAVRCGIRTIVLFGEWSSSAQRAYLRDAVPDARIVTEYASIEAQVSVACSCILHAKTGDDSVHPISESVSLEIIDLDSGEEVVHVGGMGEVVLTTVRHVPLPLIRYRTGDLGRIVAHRCPCGEPTPLIRIEGRADYDRIRIAGGEVNLVALDAAFVSAGASRFTDFQVAVRDRRTALGVQQGIVVRVPATELKRWAPDRIQAFSTALRITPDATYAHGVEEGRFAPIEIEELPLASIGKKRRRLVRESEQERL